MVETLRCPQKHLPKSLSANAALVKADLGFFLVKAASAGLPVEHLLLPVDFLQLM